MIHTFEIVWHYLGAEYTLGTYETCREALHAFNKGRPRVQMLVHGGRLEIVEVIETKAA